jgi:hypothetical protein
MLQDVWCRAGLLLVTLAGCTGGEPASVALTERTDSAGISVVVSGDADRVLSWRAERERVIGGDAQGPFAFYRLRGALVETDGEGRIVVLDPTAHRVVAFDAEGTLLWEAGREGGGPGELLAPNSLTIADGVVAVHDPRKGALVRFDIADGRLLEQQPFRHPLIRAWAAHVHLLPGNALAVLDREPYSGNDNRAVRLLTISGADTLVHFSRDLHASRTASYPACGMTLTLPVLFAPQVRWAREAARVAVNTGAHYVIDMYEDGRHTMSVRRAIRPQAVSAADAASALGDQGIGGPVAGCMASPDERLEKHGFARERQIVLALDFDADGRLWVLRHVPDSDPVIDVFDADGAYTGTLPPEIPFPVLFLSDSRIGWVERDDFDVDRLVIGRLHRN